MLSRTMNYLVCATPRTGSSVICDALAATGVAGQAHEYFHDTLMEKCCADWSVSPPESLLGYFSLLDQHARTPNGVFGAKVMYPKFVSVLQQLPFEPAISPAQLLEKQFLPGLRYVQVLRRNVLRQAVSHLRARQTDHWSSEQAQTQAPKREARYDFAALDRMVERTHQQRANWDKFFANLGTSPTTVYYEDFVSDQDNTVRSLLSNLEIEAPTPLFQRPLILERQGDALNEEWIERYLADKAS